MRAEILGAATTNIFTGPGVLSVISPRVSVLTPRAGLRPGSTIVDPIRPKIGMQFQTEFFPVVGPILLESGPLLAYSRFKKLPPHFSKLLLGAVTDAGNSISCHCCSVIAEY